MKKTEINGADTMILINDGDVLKGGRGNTQAGDKFRIMFRTNSDSYGYVIAIDGSAWVQDVFPSLTSPFVNPVKQDQQYIIPKNNNWLSLDQFQGIETIYFVASQEKRQDIEASEVQLHLPFAKGQPVRRDRTKDSSQPPILHKKPEKPYESLVGFGMSRGFP
jgi:hypothetical protein